eukprot:1138245-Pelagomonas_calceolata.AAC.4
MVMWHKNQRLFSEEKVTQYFNYPFTKDTLWGPIDKLDRFGVVVLGPCPDCHTLRRDDEIIVHRESGFAMTDDSMRWSREAFGDGEVSLYKFVDIIDYGNGEYDYKAIGGNGETQNINLCDIVINLRYRRQREAAKRIQKAWRSWRVTRIVLIQRAIKEWIYQVKWIGYRRVMQDFYTRAAALTC